MFKLLKNLAIAVLIQMIFNNFAYCDNCDMAQMYIQKAKFAYSKEKSYEYLHNAEKIFLDEISEDSMNIRALSGISKVYQMLGDRQEAKVYIVKAYNLNSNNADMQKEMGDFYYNFQEYSTAIEYYKLSLANGNLKDYDTNFRTAQCYEKLADIENAELYYKICMHINPMSSSAINKLNDFEEQKNAKYELQLKEERKKEKELQTQKEVYEIIEKYYNQNAN